MHEIPKNSHDPERNQYLAPLILIAIRKYATESMFDKVLGITNVDLCIQDRDFVTGLSEFGSHAKAAIISIYRLDPHLSNKLASKKILLMRLLIEGIHEVGHLFELTHCPNHCVMQFSEHEFEIELKPVSFCEACKEKLLKQAKL